MPKELTHWILAERTISLLDRGQVADAIKNHPHYYYLGAVIYDSPFYAIGVEHAKVFEEVARRLHGSAGEDTFDAQRGFIRTYDGRKLPEEAMSFIAGTLTHYCADVTFHPLVNYYCGKYAPDNPEKRSFARTRHRTFESLMDIFFYGMFVRERGGGFPSKLGRILKNRGRFENTVGFVSGSASGVDDLVGRFYWPGADDIPVADLLRRHGKLQKLFYNGAIGTVLDIAGKLFGGGLPVISATVYPVRFKRRGIKKPEETFPFFANPIFFNHPNTGSEAKGTAEDFAARMTTSAALLINSLQSHISRGDAGAFLEGERGFSLEYGYEGGACPDPDSFDLSHPIRTLCTTI